MAESETLFTKIIRGQIPCCEVARGEDWLAFLDINPRRAGHTLIVPHEEVRHLSKLSPPQLSSLWAGVVEAQRRLSSYFGTEDFSVGIHDGPLSGQEVPHVHVHVIPRTKGDGGKTLMACWPNSPPIGSVEPDFIALNELAEALRQV
jgi:histidine triad (HIT) family protein